MAISEGRYDDNNSVPAGLEQIFNQLSQVYVYNEDLNTWERLHVDASGALPVTGPLTNAELRETPISVTASPPPSFSLVTHNTINVTNSSQIVLASNGNRKYALLQNASNSDMWISFSGAASLDGGILLPMGGGEYEINFSNLFTGPIAAIKSGGGSKSLLITEGS